ncbi:MAG: DUF2092 domain-containing protein [Planctomycetota bacterium]|nr:MAG: DUF2092 domain-containing protein [Planctomycetota bacterium]
MFRTRQIALLLTLSVTVNAASQETEERDNPLEGYSERAISLQKRTFETFRDLKSYSDDGIVEMKTDAAFGRMNEGQKITFAMAGGRRFRLDTPTHTVASDGRELTVYMKNAQRYQVKPIEEDIAKQIEEYLGLAGMNIAVGQIMLSPKPAKLFTSIFKELDVAGSERVGEDDCAVLEGKMNASEIPMVTSDTPARVYLRKRDGLIRRVEIDLSEMMKKQMEQAPGGMSVSEFKVVYDVRDIRVNEPLEESRLAFSPPSSAKKVEKFYGGMMGGGGPGAQQFELSGHDAPAFDLPAHGGERVSLGDYRGHVVLLHFGVGGFGFQQSDRSIEKLEEIQRDYADKGVHVIYVHTGSNADKLIEDLGHEPGVVVALDPDRATAGEYFEEQWSFGAVLIDKEGVVQGRYAGFITDPTTKAMRSDLDKLLGGETLPSAKKMTAEEIDEAFEQRTGAFTMPGGAEPVNEDRLKEAWSVRASGGNIAFSSGGSKYDDRVFWVRDKGRVLGISPAGETLIELPIQKATADMFGQETFAVGKLGSNWGVVYMSTIAGDEQQPGGWRPPKAAVLTATDAEGHELWKVELKAENMQLPQHLALGDVDGRPGDEVIFFHGGAVCVLDSKGEVLVRKPCPGWASWLIVADRDRDEQAEIYVRSQYKLTRLDYER